jgi:hypothetical protein
VDINFISVRSTQDELTATGFAPMFGEIARFGAVYPALPAVNGAGLEGGFLAHPRFGVGIRFDFVDYESFVALAANVPHPTLFNRFGSDVGVTATTLKRKDRGFDISAIYIAPTSDAWRVRLFAGPTYFNVSQDMVGGIRYNQFPTIFGSNVVDINGFIEREVSGSAWGFNAGVDVAYFFSRHVGAGGVLRLNRGTVTVDDPLTGDAADLEAGDVTFGGGLRLRF